MLHVANALAEPDGVGIWRARKVDAPHLIAGNGILKVAALVGVGSGTVQRVKREMAATMAKA